MKLKDRIKIIYRFSFIFICFISLALHFDINDQYYNTHEFSFFTVQSNIFCFIMMCVILIKHFMHKDTLSNCLMYFKGMALSAILCTFLIYHFAESCNKYDLMASGIIGIPTKDLFAHYIVPAMFILDWIIFQPKGYFPWSYIAGWLIFPFSYLMGFLTRCHCNGPDAFCNVEKYPYFFLDYETLGFFRFIRYILLITVIVLFVNTLIVILDKYMAKLQKNSK